LKLLRPKFISKFSHLVIVSKMQVQDLVGFVTPSNICIAIYLKEHINGMKSGGMLGIQGYGERFRVVIHFCFCISAREPTATDRKDICILAMRLISVIHFWCLIISTMLIQVLTLTGAGFIIPKTFRGVWSLEKVLILTRKM